jgi:hypothetical protein
MCWWGALTSCERAMAATDPNAADLHLPTPIVGPLHRLLLGMTLSGAACYLNADDCSHANPMRRSPRRPSGLLQWSCALGCEQGARWEYGTGPHAVQPQRGWCECR